jgi:hypothetical protein
VFLPMSDRFGSLDWSEHQFFCRGHRVSIRPTRVLLTS